MRTFKSRIEETNEAINEYIAKNWKDKESFDLLNTKIFIDETDFFQAASLVKYKDKWFILDLEGDKWDFNSRTIEQKARILDAIIFDIPVEKFLNFVKEQKGDMDWDD